MSPLYGFSCLNNFRDGRYLCRRVSHNEGGVFRLKKKEVSGTNNREKQVFCRYLYKQPTVFRVFLDFVWHIQVDRYVSLVFCGRGFDRD